jgi:uncharacterized lipoprotein YehR (DUF1307 family)
MKKKSSVWIALFAIAISGFLTSCNDDDDPQPALEYKTEGTIKGKITGVTKDNTYTFNDDFNFTQYSLLTDAYASYQVNTDGSYDINLTRADYANDGLANISFGLSTAADTTPDDAEFEIDYYKEVDNKIIYFSMNSDDGTNTLTFTDFSFDSSTGKVKGKYTMGGATNSTTKNATVAGEFELMARKVTQ